jgi:lysozyme
MAMNFSNAGIRLVEKLEGCILEAYKDDAGVPTIGFGHTGGVYMGQKITQAQADDLLRKDLKKFVDRVNKYVKVPLNQNQFDALVIFDFNTGSLGTSTLLKKLNAGDYAGAAAQFDVWNKITDPETGEKVVSKGLINRRNAEQALFNTPVKATPVSKPVTKATKPKPSPSSSAVVAYPGHLITRGSTDHDNVKRIQRALGIQADGIFGNGTYMAVRNYQARHNLHVDGVVGKTTWNTLF